MALKNRDLKLCTCRKQENKQRFGTGFNLAMLLGCSPEETVLLVGRQLSQWKDVFPNVLHWGHVPVENSNHLLFGLVLYHADGVSSQSQLLRDLKVLKTVVRPGGTLLFFARNCYSFSRLKQFKRKKTSFSFFPPGLSFIGYKKVLQKSGFIARQGYLTLPNLQKLEEIVSVDSPLIEVPYNWHFLQRLAHRYKFFKYIADGYLFIENNNSIESTPFLKEVEKCLQESGGILDPQCRLERFDIRMRGAMVLFLFEKTSQKYLIIRVVNDLKTQVIVRRNEHFVQWLLTIKKLRGKIKKQLPSPISNFELSGSVVFIESMVNGVLAWKVNVPSVRENIFRYSCDFIYQLQLGTRRKTKIDSKVFQELFSMVNDRLESCEGVDIPFLHDVNDIVKKIKHKILGQVYELTASHGDYGYGNILVEPGSGKLIGVIDWDTGRHLEFAGLDYFNLLVQRERIEKRCGVFQAFSGAVGDILSRDSLDVRGEYAREFNISGDDLNILLYVGFLRYVSRSAQYPQVYQTEQNEYIKTFMFLKTKVPL